MVGQAAEGLQAKHVGGAVVDELQHLGGQQPAFTGLVAARDDALDAVRQMPDAGHGHEDAALQGLAHGGAQHLHRMMNSQLPSAGRMRPPSRFQRYMGSMKQYRKKSMMSVSTGSPPSSMMCRATWLLASGWYLSRISPTMPTFGPDHAVTRDLREVFHDAAHVLAEGTGIALACHLAGALRPAFQQGVGIALVQPRWPGRTWRHAAACRRTDSSGSCGAACCPTS